MILSNHLNLSIRQRLLRFCTLLYVPMKNTQRNPGSAIQGVLATIEKDAYIKINNALSIDKNMVSDANFAWL